MCSLLPFEIGIATDWPLNRWRDLTTLVAVSGGADSVALLHTLARLRSNDPDGPGLGRLVVVHLNHGWRGEESNRDAIFVRQLAKRLSLEVVVGRARREVSSGVAALVPRQEDAARKLRHRFFSDVAAKLGARYVATGHNADDQAETVLQRVLRGTGLDGLGGIPRVRRISRAATIIRPMLGQSRADVRQYLDSIGQPFREDSTNQCSDFVRNRIRHELLPLARSCYPGVDAALRRLAALASEAGAVLARQVQSLSETVLVERTPERLVLRLKPLSQVEPYLRQEILRSFWRRQHWPQRAMGFDEWQSLSSMASCLSDDGSMREPLNTVVRIFPGSVRAKKEGGLLTLTRPADTATRIELA
jgi:tRNA(Ile)-lysidine synthase